MNTETDFVKGLRALGPRGTDDNFSIALDGVEIRVRYFSGSSAHVVLDTPYLGSSTEASSGYRGPLGALSAPRPMQIELRRETSSDVAAKQSGVSAEAQVGDASFDEYVYIETPSEHDVAQRVLAAPALRASVVALLGVGVTPISLDTMDGKIMIRVDSFDRLPADAAWTVRHLATIASNVPAVRASGARLVDPWRARQFLMGAGAILGPIPACLLLFTALPERCYSSDDEGTSFVCTDPACCTPMYYGGGAGLVLGVLAAALMWPRIRGRSNSHSIRPWIAFFAVLLGVELCLTGTHLAAAIGMRF